MAEDLSGFTPVGEQSEQSEQTEKTEELSPIDEIINYVMTTPHNTNPNILRQMLMALQNETFESEELSGGTK